MADGNDPVWRGSPNFTARRDGGLPAMVVLHYTAMGSAEEAVMRGRTSASRSSRPLVSRPS